MERIFNWGIIGPGRIAHKFAQNLQILTNARLHAVASRSQERAEAFGKQYGATHCYGNYEDITRCPDLDAVYIASPHIAHCENTLLCLEHQIPVLCEKPFAMNAGQVQQMITKAREKDTFLMEAFWTRFIPHLLKTMEWIEGGVIGEVQSIKADFGFKAAFDPKGRLYNHDLGGGSLLDIGIYPVFLSLLILGNPKSIKATARIGQTNIDEECGIVLQYEDGKMAHLHSTILADTQIEAFIYGKKGTIHIHPRWHEPSNLTLHLYGQKPEEVLFENAGHGYEHEAMEVMRCITTGKKESDLLPLSFSLDLIQLLDAIREEAGIVYLKFD